MTERSVGECEAVSVERGAVEESRGNGRSAPINENRATHESV